MAKTTWIDHQFKLIKAIDSDPVSHWEAINNLMKGFTGHHKKARIIKMVDMATGRKATCAKDNANIFATRFGHKVFNRNKESTFNLEVLNEIKVIQ